MHIHGITRTALALADHCIRVFEAAYRSHLLRFPLATVIVWSSSAKGRCRCLMSIEDLMTHRVSIYALYFKIAFDMRARFQVLADEYNSLEKQPISTEDLETVKSRMEQCYSEKQQCAVIGVTFAGMALEAFFYDYAAEKLGDGIVKKHLDKLDLKSKFLIYARLVCGRSPDESGTAYRAMTALVALRNYLVHFKSKQFSTTQLDKASGFHSDLDARLESGIVDAVDCVFKVMAELDQLHGGEESYGSRMLSFVSEKMS